jgi:hypothetical protein
MRWAEDDVLTMVPAHVEWDGSAHLGPILPSLLCWRSRASCFVDEVGSVGLFRDKW